MAQPVVTGIVGDFLRLIRDTSSQVIEDTQGDALRAPDAPVFTTTGQTAAQALSETGPS